MYDKLIMTGGNMKDYTLLILAAGMGSRFGGLKQIEPFGPNGEFIIDYSIKDAIKAGFNKAVFIIKKENLEIFKNTIGKRIEKHIKVEYVFQELDDLSEGFVKPEERTKPWGTGQAILAAKNIINEPFAIINADDFYGYDAFKKLIDYMKNIPKDINKKQYGLVGYLMRDTLSENGSVKRGICQLENNKIVNLIEAVITLKHYEMEANPLGTEEHFKIKDDTLASMNMFAFDPSIFSFLEKEFKDFLKDNINVLNSEFIISSVLDKALKDGYCDLNIIKTSAKWFGVTYREDIPLLKKVIEEKIKSGECQEHLWN